MEDHLEAEDAAVGVVVLEAVVCESDEDSEVDTAEEDFVAVEEEEVDSEAAEVAEEVRFKAEEVAVEAKPMVKAARKSNSRKK